MKIKNTAWKFLIIIPIASIPIFTIAPIRVAVFESLINIQEIVFLKILNQEREPGLSLNFIYQTKNADPSGNYKRIYDMKIESPHLQNSFRVDITSSSTIRGVDVIPLEGFNSEVDCERFDDGVVDDTRYNIRCSNPKFNNYKIIINTRNLYCGDYFFKVYINENINDFILKQNDAC